MTSAVHRWDAGLPDGASTGWGRPMTTSRNEAAAGLAQARALAGPQEDVATWRQLYAAGVPRWLVRRELRVGRWQRSSSQTVALHNGPLPDAARRWVAVLELGPRAALDGVTALQAAGVTALTDEVVHVVVPRGAQRRRLTGVRRHESRRWRAEDVVKTGIPRVRPAVAAVHAALWARTEREAVYVVTLAVQQRVCAAEELARAVGEVRRGRWRRALIEAAADLVGGVRSLGELDVARAMRERGLPEPARQVLRRRPSGREYLDADFPAYGISLEVDGAQHDEPDARLSDLLRDLGLAADGRTVVRIPLVAWRLDRKAVLDALEELFSARGWRRPAA